MKSRWTPGVDHSIEGIEIIDPQRPCDISAAQPYLARMADRVGKRMR